MPDVDDVAEITVGVVKGVTELLATLRCQAAPHAALLIADFLQFILVVIQVYSDCDTWRRRRDLVLDCGCLVDICIREEVVVVTGVVVDKTDSFHGTVILFSDLRNYRHENLKILEVGVLCVVFFVQWNALLEREFRVF